MPTPSPTNPYAFSYSYTPNGTGGVNYFQNSKPITNAQYAAGTSADTNTIERFYADQYNKTQSQIPGPNAPAYNAGGSNSVSTYDPVAAQTAAATAAQKAQLQSQLGQLDPQLNLGLQNIGNSYNMNANRLDEQNAVAQRNYDTQAQGNSQSYLNTRNGIQQNTRATANSLQRLLGLNGAGNSSAAYEQAPYAAALQGTQQLTGAQQTYGKNSQALDTNWQDTQRSYKNSKSDLDTQKYQQENGLRSSIAQTRANILSQLQSANGTTENQNAINDLLKQITGYSQQYANPIARVADLQYKAPDLGQYTLGKFANIGGGGGGAQSDISPTFLNLLAGEQKRDDYGNLLG